MNNNLNAIRILSVDMIEKANSGHPGMCLGATPIIYTLYTKIMDVNPKNSKWFNRDRFILSAGHGSAMYYSVLHLSGYDVSIQDLQNFRQFDSLTPGHPEVNHTDGIDATSGPLGQGIAQAVGMALAEVHLAEKYNKSIELINNHTYVLCGDGDLQEGVSSEASSLAGHLNLNKLMIIWDSNQIQLDDATSVATSEEILKRYESYGFDVFEVSDGNDLKLLQEVIEKAKDSKNPSFIKVNTVIGYGSKNKAGSSESHGAPLGKEEIKYVREFFKWSEKPFEISEEIYKFYNDAVIKKGILANSKWDEKFEQFKKMDYDLAIELEQLISNKYNYDFNLKYENSTNEATRVSSGKAINYINEFIPNLIGGSADLSKSNNSKINASGIFSQSSYDKQNISYGVREFAMGAITNGIMLYGGIKAFCATFFVFSDYLKPAIRMSALQKIPSIFIFTHDSIAVGEDGPTHQPIEQLSGLRAIPNLNIFRPCDYNETIASYKCAIMSNSTPSALVLTRQNLEGTTSGDVYKNVKHGAYILFEDENPAQLIMASGSEVKLALDAKAILNDKGINVRIVSVVCFDIFDKQDDEYKNTIFSGIKYDNRFFIEMSSGYEGYKYARNIIGMNKFGMSAPANRIINAYGFTPEEIAKKVFKNEF